MQTFDLIAAVTRKVLDPSYTEEEILVLLNMGLLEVASGGDRQHGNALLPPLPGLFAFDTVKAPETGTLTLPDDYLREVTRVEWNGDKLKKFTGQLNTFFDRHRSFSGHPRAFCVVGKALWVAPAPAEDEEFEVYYYRKPEVLTTDADEPEGIPEHLQMRLLVNYACKEIFSEIEQGIGGGTPNTNRHDAEYQRALTDLERFIGPVDGDAIHVADEPYTDDMTI